MSDNIWRDEFMHHRLSSEAEDRERQRESSICGGCVEWKGPLSNLTHTERSKCGAKNCQEVEEQETMNDANAVMLTYRQTWAQKANHH